MSDGEAFEEIVRQLEPAHPPRTSADGWYTIRVELVHGRGRDYEPPPGRDILISPQHTFRQLAELMNSAFARWDLGRLYRFELHDGSRIGLPDWDDMDEDLRDAARTKIGRRYEGEVFGYVFDFGDDWTHRCTVTAVEVTPESERGVRPNGPVVTWGWGAMPDQYGRRTPDGGDEESEADT